MRVRVRLLLLIASTLVVLALVSPREAWAQCWNQCTFVCCSEGYACSPDGASCIPPSGSCESVGKLSCGAGCCPAGDYKCCGTGCCGPGMKCGDVPGSCVEDDDAALPACAGVYPVECGNGNCCSPSDPVCCAFTCCPLGTTCSANGFQCLGEPSITCAADKHLTRVACDGETPYCECASACTSDEQCATGCCSKGVCSHPCQCKTGDSNDVIVDVPAAMCPVPSLGGSRTGGLGRGGCAVDGGDSSGLLLAAFGVLLVIAGRRRPSKQ